MAVHEPVMVAQVLAHLEPSRGGVFVDCTVGLGGHARALLEGGASRVIGLDRDPQALAIARNLGWQFDIMKTSFFLSRRALKPAPQCLEREVSRHRANSGRSRLQSR